jgi:hypothetical protein
MITGRIVRIFDAHTVAINVGSAQGVEPSMRFGIYTPYEEVIDPENGARLGRTRRRKAVIQVSYVHPNFTIATTPMYRVQSKSTQNLLGAFSTVEVEQRQDPLPVARGEMQPYESGDEIRVGDQVEEIVQTKASR